MAEPRRRRQWSGPARIIVDEDGDVLALYGPHSRRMVLEDLRAARRKGLRVHMRTATDPEYRGMPPGCKEGVIFDG
jgi:hypothetical protein